MVAYLVRRLLLVIPTLFGVMVINFAILQALPGGPIDQIMAKIQGVDVSPLAAIQQGDDEIQQQAKKVDEELREKLTKEFGYDKPLHEQFFTMMGRYLRFDFGESIFVGEPVVDIVIEKLPVSISLGIWTVLLSYLISIPLGIRKAIRDGTKFDAWTSIVVIIGSAIPGFLFALLLIVLFAGGRFFAWFPIRGLVSSNFAELAWWQQIFDYFWHLCLPIIAMSIGGFATLTLLTKNSVLEHINQQYVMLARSKGATEARVLYGHVFRNAMLIVIAAFPSAFIGIFFTGSLLIEVLFSLDGLGLLGYEAVLQRDYPIVMASLFFFSTLGLLMGILTDFIYTLIDPRIHFERQTP